MTSILLIEDVTPLRESIAQVLQLSGYEVLAAEDGFEGLSEAREHLPDIIVCDIMMPELNGYEVLSELRNDSKTASIPFIFLTAKADQPDVRLGMEMGADDYLTKPFTNRELLTAIDTRLKKRAADDAQQLRTLTRKFLRLQENERHAFARAIQENIGQPLSGLKLSLQGAERLPLQQLEAKLVALQQLADQILAQVNITVNDLWPVMLDELGLLPALLHHFEQIYERTGVRVNFTHSGLDNYLAREIKIITYRVIQEVLWNSVKYAQIQLVNVEVWQEDENLHIDIEDQGRGFDFDQVLAAGKMSGLLEINERVSELNGEITIQAARGVGVRVIVIIPTASHNDDNPSDDMPIKPRLAFVPTQLDFETQPSSTEYMTTVLIAEENQIIREGLKQNLLNADAQIDVIGEASNRRDVLKAVSELQPQILFLGMTMAGVSNLDLIEAAKKLVPDLKVLIFANQSHDVYVYEAVRFGAAGYVVNNVEVGELIEAIRVVARGDTYWSTSLTEETMQRGLDTYQTSSPEVTKFNSLTLREREILQMIAQGNTSKQIAGALSISPRTAETHRTNVARKLGLRTQADLIRFALKYGLGGNTKSGLKTISM